MGLVSAGAHLASLLEGSWREPVVRTTASAETIELAIAGGSGGLAYRRVGDVAPALKDLVRHQILEAARFEQGLKDRLRSLRVARIPAVLVKGWAIARHYPDKGMRHYSDLDLVVAPEHRARAEAIIGEHASDRLETDLHFAIPYVQGRDRAALEARIVEVPLGDEIVRVLGDEDHLWLLALHGLGHGLARSVWLVDLAVLVERGPVDWDYLERGPEHGARALRMALLLARRVLGARLDATPLAHEMLPAWVEPALLAEWSTRFEGYEPLTRVPRLDGLVKAARRRWPNPIRATAGLHAPWNEWPRLPIQLLEFGRRFARFARAHDGPRGIWAK